MSEATQLAERALYRLSLDPQARALAERLLKRFRGMVGNLPASAEDHHSESGGLYEHSLEVGLKALEEFEGNIIMERKPDGSIDSFRSARNRPFGGNMRRSLPLCVTTWGSCLTSKCAVGNRDGVLSISL